MDGEAAHTIGRRVRQIRYAREKSLRMVAGLAGLSTTKLRRIETGQRALDSRSEIVALANALQVAPSELTTMDVPAPGNGTTDLAVEAVRVSLMAVNHGYPGGEVLLVDVLRERVGAVISAGCTGDQELTGRELPALIRDLHTSIAAGRDVAELLGLGAVRAMLSTGAFGLAQAELDSVTVPTTTPETMQLDGMLALYRAEVAAADSRPGDVKPALAHADEMAERTGEGNAYWLGFGPTNTGFCRSSVALDLKDYDMAVTAAESVDPRLHSNRSRQAAYWVYYGRALARRRERHNDAVRALRQAELIVPHRVQRDPFARDVLAELLARSRRDAVGRELRGMAYRPACRCNPAGGCSTCRTPRT